MALPYEPRQTPGQTGNHNPAALQTREPRGGAGFPGRDKSRPYESILCFGANGTAAATRAAVGRDALIPPDPAAARTPAGGYGIRPYDRRHGVWPNGKPQPCGIANPCRGRFHIGPDRGGAGFPGRDKSRPYE